MQGGEPGPPEDQSRNPFTLELCDQKEIQGNKPEEGWTGFVSVGAGAAVGGEGVWGHLLSGTQRQLCTESCGKGPPPLLSILDREA